LAALIGIYCGLKIKRANVQGSSSYSISFFMFACMMTDAMIWHCFLNGYNNWSIWADVTGIIDGALSSCVAMSFGFNALFDVGVMQEGRKSAVIMSVSYLAMIGAWTYSLLNSQNWSIAFLVLYGLVIAVCCGLYSIVTLIRVIRSKGVGLKNLLIGVAAGALGLISVFYSPLSAFWCNMFGAYLNSEWWWFILSDVSMYYLYKYFMESHVPTTTKTYSYYEDSDDSDVELNEESDEEGDEETPLQPQYIHVPQQVQPQPMYYVPVPYYPNQMHYGYTNSQVSPVYHTQQL
jgi:hypothetical protein